MPPGPKLPRPTLLVPVHLDADEFAKQLAQRRWFGLESKIALDETDGPPRAPSSPRSPKNLPPTLQSHPIRRRTDAGIRRSSSIVSDAVKGRIDLAQVLNIASRRTRLNACRTTARVRH